MHYHGYQELHVAQVLLPAWHEPFLCFVLPVDDGSQILQGVLELSF